MSTQHAETLSKSLNLQEWQVENTLNLIGEGATIPFISRYRKERTGNLDETQITQIKEQHEKLVELEKRRDTILKTIDEQEQLTDELEEKIRHASTMQELEDLYLPYKPKKRTRATKAKEKGLEPLASILIKQHEPDPESKAEEFLTDEVKTIEEALLGAKDIMAEWISENQKAREQIRSLFYKKALIESKVKKNKEEEGEKYQEYFEWSELLRKCPYHSFL